jgi:hypothetical protein
MLLVYFIPHMYLLEHKTYLSTYFVRLRASRAPIAPRTVRACHGQALRLQVELLKQDLTNQISHLPQRRPSSLPFALL